VNLPTHIYIDQAATVLAGILKDKQYSQVAVLTDENSRRHCLPGISQALPADMVSIQIKSGEEHKNLQTCAHIWEELTLAGFDRKGLLINLGGGVITDMGGFCAATYKRGIHFINIPTTLLSQVDASAGGKLGIDFNSFKNHIGVFKDAEAVIIDPAFLGTLPLRELRSGYAEVIKHALIADAAHWEALKKNHWQQQPWEQIIHHSVGIKHRITTADPTEQGLRKVLNFGHTIGHAIESYFLEQGPEKLLHGEAIAIGMLCEAYLSLQKSGLPAQGLADICAYISETWALPHIPGGSFDTLCALTLQDKKNEKGTINCTLLSQVGEAVYNQAINQQDITNALNWYNKKGWQEANL
jgi:3-dehydroquinate synthase